MVVDSHTHVYTYRGKTYTARDLLASMDEAEIDYSLLIADGFAKGGTPTDEVIKICEENPRLKAIGCVHYKKLDNAQIERLTTLLEKGKINGVKLYPPYEFFYPQDEKLFPFYEKCQQMGKPIIVHTGILMPGLPGLLKQSHPLNLDDIANAFPKLKIVMAHFGNPWITDAMMVMLKNKNVYADISGYFEAYAHIPQKHIKYFIQDLTYIKNFLGDFKRFLFASDWPLYSQKEYLDAVKQIPMTSEEKDLVFWKNAKEIFNLKI